MNEQERNAIVGICALAAQADGERNAEEQAQFARVAARLGSAESAPVAALPDLAKRLGSAEGRDAAYESAVSVIYADGDANQRERAFLEELRAALHPGAATEAPAALAQRLGTAPVGGPLPDAAPSQGEPAPRVSQAGIPALSHDAALDAMIRRQAILAGALELLPQSLATMAIIPIQMRLVYRIGADFGQRLDGPQIKDLLGAMGVGAAAQMVDGLARRLLGGLAGGLLGGAAGAVAGIGVAFVTTYALGHAAKQYYAQGRNLSRDDLRALFQRFQSEAQGLLPTVRDELQRQSRQLDLGRLVATLRGATE